MIEAAAPAKLNLFLEVTGRRPDGYHRLATIFAKIDLADRLTFEPAASLSLEIDDRRKTGPALTAGPDNLVMKAARALRGAFKLRAGAKITLEKRIPVGAGLGGGSSDAAATLRGLARLWDLPRTAAAEAALMRLARDLGADVPFFMQPRPVCLGTGAGDRLTPIEARVPAAVLIYPGVPVSTAEAYHNLALPRRKTVLTSLSLLYRLRVALKRGGPVGLWSDWLANRLEDAVLDRVPAVKDAKRALRESGAAGVLMSGSGSAVFGFAGPSVVSRLRRARPEWEIFVVRVLDLHRSLDRRVRRTRWRSQKSGSTSGTKASSRLSRR